MNKKKETKFLAVGMCALRREDCLSGALAPRVPQQADAYAEGNFVSFCLFS